MSDRPTSRQAVEAFVRVFTTYRYRDGTEERIVDVTSPHFRSLRDWIKHDSFDAYEEFGEPEEALWMLGHDEITAEDREWAVAQLVAMAEKYIRQTLSDRWDWPIPEVDDGQA